MKFANIFFDIEYMLTKEINNNLNTGLIENWYSLHGISIDWIDKEVEIDGYDRYEGEEFVIKYNYESKFGRMHYLNGKIKLINVMK